jgi:hypothetical protein
VRQIDRSGPCRPGAGSARTASQWWLLPLMALVWTDGHQTNVSQTAPSELAVRYDLSDELTAGLAGIDAETDVVIGR